MIRFITIILIGLFLTVNCAYADESYNMTSCWSGDYKMLSSSKELVIYSFDLKGVSRKNDESDAFHNWSFHLIGMSKIESGTYSSSFFGKWMSPEGDMVFGEGNRIGEKGTWKFIGGTGKWAGITGGGTNENINIKPVMNGTTQGCSIAIGTYKLPQ